MPISGYKQTEEHKRHISEALRKKRNKPNVKPCYIIETGEQFTSQLECAKAIGVHESTITTAIKYNFNTRGGHIASGWAPKGDFIDKSNR